jgi:16S rRNA (uracil1498-N3)-methyltransferase
MAVKSVYMPLPAFEGESLRILGDEHRHLAVARVELNEAVEVFDGEGSVWRTNVVGHSRSETTVRVVRKDTVPPEPHEIVLALALIRPAAFELALEKVVEVGVTAIIPVLARRSNVPAGRHDRWWKIIVEAGKQSKRYRLPRIEEPRTFSKVLALQAPTRILFAERGGGHLRPAIAGSPVVYLVGPEGGWVDQELEEAKHAGFSLVSFGKGTLKAETAAIVGAALIRHELQPD